MTGIKILCIDQHRLFGEEKEKKIEWGRARERGRKRERERERERGGDKKKEEKREEGRDIFSGTPS